MAAGRGRAGIGDRAVKLTLMHMAEEAAAVQQLYIGQTKPQPLLLQVLSPVPLVPVWVFCVEVVD
jgi:hypothetical protein